MLARVHLGLHISVRIRQSPREQYPSLAFIWQSSCFYVRNPTDTNTILRWSSELQLRYCCLCGNSLHLVNNRQRHIYCIYMNGLLEAFWQELGNQPACVMCVQALSRKSQKPSNKQQRVGCYLFWHNIFSESWLNWISAAASFQNVCSNLVQRVRFTCPLTIVWHIYCYFTRANNESWLISISVLIIRLPFC